jgi:hypothetical protein
MLSNFNKPDAGSVDLNKALNDLIKLGQRDPNILLKYSQNPPPEYGSQGKLIVSLAASAVARDKSAVKTMEPSPTQTVSEQINNKLVESTQPQGIAGLNPPPMMPPEMMAQAPQMSQAPTEMMAQGGVADLNVGNMFDENNYANGGIVSFAAGGSSYDPFDISNYRMKVPDIPTADDLSMQTSDLKSRFVDPNYYADTEKSIKADTLADLADVKKAGQADILFSLAEGYGTTPGSFLRGTVAAGVKAGPAVRAMNKDMNAAKRLSRDAVYKLNQAKQAESVGDFKTAMELRKSAETNAFEADKLNATLGAKLATERAKILKTAGLDEKKLKVQVEKIATEKMKAQYPGGSFETLMRNRPDVYSTELNRYKKETEDYILRDISAKTLPDDYMDKLQANKANASLSGKSNAKSTKAPIAAQPANRTNLLNKYPATGSRSTNTAAEMQLTDPMYDNMGDQDDYLQ